MSLPIGLERDRSAGLASGGEVPVQLLGRRAGEALFAESAWRVQAVFRRSLYCRSRRGAWVCVGLREIGAGPLNVLVDRADPIDWEASLPAVGASAVCDGTRLRVGERLTLRLDGAQVWRPAAPPRPWQREVLRQGLEALARAVNGRPTREGLQALIPLLVDHATTEPLSAAGGDPLVRLALEGVGPLAAWLRSGFERPTASTLVPPQAVEALLGLGPGLTPSGDDLLAGMLVALHGLGASEIAGRLAREVLARAAERTHAISGAHLAAAAAGEGAAPLHALLVTLCTTGAPGLRACLNAVDGIGQSSGWDAVAGISLAAAQAVRAGFVPGETAPGT